MDAFADTFSTRQPTLADIHALLKQGRATLAAQACQRLLAAEPNLVDGWLLFSRIAQQLSQFAEMRTAAARAQQLAPQDFGALQRLIESHIYCGDLQLARAELAAAEQRLLATPANVVQPELAKKQAAQLQQLAQLYSHCASHEQANRCYRTACSLQPEHPAYLYNLAASQLTVGDLDGAERSLDRCLALAPRDYDAHYLRSSLRTQTDANNHLAELEALLEQAATERDGDIALSYALAKEREDLGQHDRAFQAVRHGAQQRRRRLAYRVETDLAAMTAIADAFNAELFRHRDRSSLREQPLHHEQPSHNDNGTASTSTPAVTPIFVLGLPRSGTTLVDRILGSHSAVDSLGEINDFAFALIRSLGHTANKLELIKRSAYADHAQIGQEYRRSTAGYGRSAGWLIDKTPLNFLYLGLIHLALPEAPIVHLRRHPLDSCYAMYKTLFRMGYPFSYSLDDLARYYAGYQRLMNHWRSVLPGSFLDLDYEQLVSEQEPQSRRLLAHCGLAWQDSCLEFHRNQRPAATASAAQVRQPLHQRSVQQWKHYAAQLAPLAAALREQGVAVPEYDWA